MRLKIEKFIQEFRIQNIPVYILHLLFFLIPLGSDLISITTVLLTISTLIFSKKNSWYKSFIRGKHSYLPLLAFFALHLIGMFLTDSFPNAVKELEKELSFIVFPLFLPFLNLNRKDVYNLFNTFFLSCLLIITLSFLDFIYVSFSSEEYIILGEITTGNRPGGVYDYLSKHFLIVDVHRTYFSVYLLISVSFVYYFLKKNYIKLHLKQRIFFATSLVLLVIGIILIQSKSTIAILIIIFTYYFLKEVINTTNKNYLLTGIVVLLISSLILSDLISNRLKPMINEIENILEEGNDNEKEFTKKLRPGSTEIRYMLYKSSIQIIKEAPVFGHGTGDVKSVLKCQNKKNSFISIAHLNYGPHSQVLYLLIQFGIIGAICFLAIFLFSIRENYNNNDYFAVLIIVILFLSCITESFLIRQEGIVPTALFITTFSFLKESVKKGVDLKAKE